MNRNSSFQRKILYIVGIALLLLPLSALSQPATVGSANNQGGTSPGGTLSQLRETYNLSQAELGEIDPTSETMKLACLGMRGIAADILWINANHYKKVEDFDNLELTVNQLKRLEPNFLKVWDFQAHNLAYNTSVEFDNYRQRYEWVKKGTRFLIEGTNYNRDEPGLLHSIGWYVGNKFGTADEKKQFRRLFRGDKDFHSELRLHGVDVDQALGPDNKPDNWLTAKLWYDKAVAATEKGKPIRLHSPLMFYRGSAMGLINGADAMEKDGVFGQKAEVAWNKANVAWNQFGDRPIMSTSGYNIRLNAYESLEKDITETYAKIDALSPGILAQMQQEILDGLTPEHRAIADKKVDDMTEIEQMIYNSQILPFLRPRPDSLAAKISGANRVKGRELTDQLNQLINYARTTLSYRGQVSYMDWLARCESEMTKEGMNARRLVYEAEQERDSGANLEGSRKKYEEGFRLWADILKKWPVLCANAEFRELVDSVGNYRKVLNQLDAEFPSDFPLETFLSMRPDGMKLKEDIRRTQESMREQKSKEKAPPEEEAKDKVVPETGDGEKAPAAETPTTPPAAEPAKTPEVTAAEGTTEEKAAPPADAK